MSRCLPTTLMLFLLCGCGLTNDAITESSGQLQLRQIQTREYETLDTRATLRSVIATLQDLGFVIDKASIELATVSATKLRDYKIRITVTVRERGAGRVAVRANASLDEKPIDDAHAYQDFFAALDKAIFLTMHDVD